VSDWSAHSTSIRWASGRRRVAFAAMAVVRGLIGRLRGDDIAALRAEVAALREIVETTNHQVVENHRILSTLNHDVRAGSEDVLPLFLGYAQRFRTDADTMVGVTELIDRQLAAIEQQVDRLVAAGTTHDANEG